MMKVVGEAPTTVLLPVLVSHQNPTNAVLRNLSYVKKRRPSGLLLVLSSKKTQISLFYNHIVFCGYVWRVTS